MKKSLIILAALVSITAGSTSAFATTIWTESGNNIIGYGPGKTTICTKTYSGMTCF